ncbi:MAG: domain containing protein [Chthonomonadaceae bacterium]|nr:domain containing protein [Chthonomonadaceae bacterium]
MGGFGQDPIPGYDLPGQKTTALPLTPETAALRLLNGPAAGRTFPLTGLRLRVGRTDAKAAIHADIDLTDCEQGSTPKISRRHAELQWADATLRLIDLGSANGTWHNTERLALPNGKPLSAPVSLAPGDRIRFANLEFEVVTQ